MRTSGPWLLAFVIVATTFAALHPSATAEAQRRRKPRTGTLVITGDHYGADVFLDSEPIGTLPIEPLEVEAGEHSVRVVQPGFTEYNDVVTVESGEEKILTIELLAISMVLHVETVPNGGRVFVDGKFGGEAPVDLDLLEGEHSIMVRMAGHREAVRKIEAVAGKNESIEVSLEPIPIEERTIVLEPDEWYEQPVTWIAVGGGAVVLAVGAIILAAVLSSDTADAVEEHCEPGCHRFIDVMPYHDAPAAMDQMSGEM